MSVCFTGEVFGGLHMEEGQNDAAALLAALSATSDIAAVVTALRGPWSLAYYRADSQTLWFGRDIVGDCFLQHFFMRVEKFAWPIISSTCSSLKGVICSHLRNCAFCAVMQYSHISLLSSVAIHCISYTLLAILISIAGHVLLRKAKLACAPALQQSGQIHLGLCGPAELRTPGLQLSRRFG